MLLFFRISFIAKEYAAVIAWNYIFNWRPRILSTSKIKVYRIFAKKRTFVLHEH